MKNQADSSKMESLKQENFDSVLEQVLRDGARTLLLSALENEIKEHLERFEHHKDKNGHRYVVRNGYQPEREIITGLGPVRLRKPRVHDRSGCHRFTSTILPKFMHRVPSIDNLVPVLYLKGISTGDFPCALNAILGDSVTGLSATNIVRLKQVWTNRSTQSGTNGI